MITSRSTALLAAWVALLCAGAAVAAAATAPAPDAREVSITFRVAVPAATPADATLYLIGSAAGLGEWKEPGVALKKGDDGNYTATAPLPAGRELEYKVTRGSWATVEKKGDGAEMHNRTLVPTRPATIDVRVAAWADQVKAPTAATTRRAATRTGDIRAHQQFASKILSNARDVLVYLPPGYEQAKDRRYPVLYLHDGQNVFDAATSFAGEWRADETAERLIADGKIEPLIIVAIANNGYRMNEYTLDRSDRHAAGGGGEAYARFVVEELKPFVDATYRTKTGRDDTGVGGSSLGGVISLEMCRLHPDVFGKCAALSPAVFWAGGKPLERLKSDHAWVKRTRVWIDAGTEEGDQSTAAQHVEGLRAIEQLLRTTGREEGKDFRAVLVERAQHNEAAWADRFDDVLTFLFPAPPAATTAPK